MKSAITLLTLLWVPFFAFTQVLEGKILGKKRSPIVGAYIINVTTQEHTHSNDSGAFWLKNCTKGDTLQIIHLGYKTHTEILPTPNSPIIIEMKESVFQLDEVVVGRSDRSLNLLSGIDLTLNPVNSSQEILRKVPGLFIGQHAGGGKAEQIFLRGFDIDHGTDISLKVDGMPVNMVSHAHGQGYADLHFLIPETIDKIDFGKGTYHADQGNFATAGYVNFKTKDQLESSLFTLDIGQFNTSRALGMFNILNNTKQQAYIASSYLLTDGPFESPQNFNRLNLMGKFQTQLPNDAKLSVIASHFQSRWDASGQIPFRAINAGLITRFGAIDETEGGQTSRTNLALNFQKIVDEKTFIKSNIYYSMYDFELYSNFTFFLRDPENGDQIRQREKRQLFGFESTWNHSNYLGNVAASFQAGIGMRVDLVEDNELSYTINRITTQESIQLGEIQEANTYGFLNAEFEFGKFLVNPSVRLDFLNGNYKDALSPNYSSMSVAAVLASPKLNLIYNPNRNLQYFIKTGYGFHSNDTRVVLGQSGRNFLPRALGVDLGAIWKPTPRLITEVALWNLDLEQEFVYVGDEGIVEPSGRTKRSGLDLGIRYQMKNWLFADADWTYTYARSTDEPEGAQYIPLAPIHTLSGGISMQKDGFSGSMKVRYLANRPANEDYSIVAKGYTIVDLNLGYKYRQLSWNMSIENLFNSDWEETQFATQSRLPGEELEGIEEVHFTPGTPFFFKTGISYEF